MGCPAPRVTGLLVNPDDHAAMARDVAEIANIAPPHSAPYIGTAAFTHKGGQHIDAMSKAAYTYQHVDPALVGNQTHIVVSEQSGRRAVLDKASNR